MDVQQMAPQQQPKCPSVIWMRVSTGFVTFLALLWRFIVWIWGILIIGIVVGVLGNAFFTLLTTGKIDLTGTLTVIAWLYTHLSLCLTIVTLTLVITFCSYLAHRWRQRMTQENQRAHDEALVVVAKGVQRALDELNTKPSTLPSSPSPPVPENKDTTPPKVLWNVPYRRNPFFTGREELLKQLHENLTTTKAAALTQAQAISGLGGIGKTQTAVEYAYHYRDEYRGVLWVNAATRETILTSYAELAEVLTLPERTEQDEQKIVAAVKQWLMTRDHWLLIFDNADDLALVEEFLPARGKGHLLLATRAHAAGTLANAMEVEQMDLHESMLLLLRRARVLALEATLDQASAADCAAAKAIAREMDGLPLALDQAGAYIEETQCRLSSYLEQYRSRQTNLLQRRGGTGKDHPEPVATTWSISFEQVEQHDPLAADLLRCCVFLAPDAIPEQLIVDGATELGPRLQPLAVDASRLDEAIGTLLRFSLVKRNRDEQTITVHRLVQAILITSLDATTRRTWAERTVRALKRAFPGATDYRTWSRCQQYLPHALACVLLMDQWEPVSRHRSTPQRSWLLRKAACAV
jgi:hypothetical protein